MSGRPDRHFRAIYLGLISGFGARDSVPPPPNPRSGAHSVAGAVRMAIAFRCNVANPRQHHKGIFYDKFGFVGEQFPSSVAYGDTFPPGGRLVCATFAIVWWRAIMASHEGEAVSEAD